MAYCSVKSSSTRLHGDLQEIGVLFGGPCPNTESRPGRCSKPGPVDSSASPAVAYAGGEVLVNRIEVG